MMNDSDVQALFQIRKARRELHDGGLESGWADSLLNATSLVGPRRRDELAQHPATNIRISPVDCDLCGDYGIHIDDDGRRDLCPELQIEENDDGLRCQSCGDVPGAIGASWDTPICGRCLQPMWLS